jgi:hypothetical protein
MTGHFLPRQQAEGKACPFVAARRCLIEGCMAWDEKLGCKLISPKSVEPSTTFENELTEAAPLMYRSLLDLVRILEDTAKECPRCGPEMWSYAQEVRACLLDKLIQAELACLGIKKE